MMTTKLKERITPINYVAVFLLQGELKAVGPGFHLKQDAVRFILDNRKSLGTSGGWVAEIVESVRP